MDNFVEIIKDLMLDKNIKSCRSLSSLSGVSQMQLSRMLAGNMPNINVAIRLSKFFDCSLDYLFGFSLEKSSAKVDAFSTQKFLSNYEKFLKENNTSHYKFSMSNPNLSESAIRRWRAGETPKTTTIINIARSLTDSIDLLLL